MTLQSWYEHLETMYEHLEKQLKEVRKNYKKDDTSWGNVWSLGCIKGLEQAQDWVKEAQKLPKEQIEQTYHNLNDKLTNSDLEWRIRQLESDDKYFWVFSDGFRYGHSQLHAYVRISLTYLTMATS